MASCGLRCKLSCSKVKKEGYIDAYDFSLADQEVDLLAMSLCKQLDHSLLVYLGNMCTAAEVAGKD